MQFASGIAVGFFYFGENIGTFAVWKPCTSMQINWSCCLSKWSCSFIWGHFSSPCCLSLAFLHCLCRFLWTVWFHALFLFAHKPDKCDHLCSKPSCLNGCVCPCLQLAASTVVYGAQDMCDVDNLVLSWQVLEKQSFTMSLVVVWISTRSLVLMATATATDIRIWVTTLVRSWRSTSLSSTGMSQAVGREFILKN